MQVELNLPDQLVRKLRALNILLGGVTDMDSYMVQALDEAVTAKIVEASGATVTVAIAPAPSTAPPLRRLPRDAAYDDLTGISDGLGDPEPTQPPPRRAAPRPGTTQPRVQGGLSDAALARDMELADPEHEAKVEAPTWEAQLGSSELAPTAEEAFAFAADMPAPPHVEEDVAPARRRATVDRKRVSPFTGSEQHSL